MSKAVIGVLAAAWLAASPAHAASPAEGWLCDSLSLDDPQAGRGVQTAVVWGGPLDAADPGATISMRCSIQGGWWNEHHSGADAYSVESAASTGRASIPPTRASYVLPPGPAYLCTEATVDGVTYYWDGDGGTWSTSGGVPCDIALAPVRHLENTLNDWCSVDLCLYPPFGDSIFCPVVAIVFPPEGDVPGVWDCPPYGA